METASAPNLIASSTVHTSVLEFGSMPVWVLRGKMKDQTHPPLCSLEARLDQPFMHHNRICSACGYGTDRLLHTD